MRRSHGEQWRALAEHVQTASGKLTPAVRRVIFAKARAQVPHPSDKVRLSPALASFIDLVAERSYRVSDRDVDELLDSGYSEDQIFEAIVVAAVAAGDRRLAAVRRAVEEA